jgi:branched-chain amino acid transport system permease protein
VARIGALLPFALMIVMLLFRPRGLMGTRDT